MDQKQLRHLEGNPAASLEWVWIGALEVWRLGGFPFKNQGFKSPTPPIQTNNSGLAEPLPFRRKKNETETTTTVPCFCGVPLPNPARYLVGSLCFNCLIEPVGFSELDSQKVKLTFCTGVLPATKSLSVCCSFCVLLRPQDVISVQKSGR